LPNRCFTGVRITRAAGVTVSSAAEGPFFHGAKGRPETTAHSGIAETRTYERRTTNCEACYK
jgi:hypothetical protein